MIAHIRGEIFETNEGYCIVETNSIGYEVFLPQRIIEKYKKGDTAHFYIFHRIKEDQNTLFGFELKEEKLFFQQLISVSGVGPKSAILALEFTPNLIHKAIEEEDIKFLSQIKGMGKKTVSRLILELKGKLPDLSHNTQSNKKQKSYSNKKQEECTHTLENLGFSRSDIQSLFTNNTEKIENESQEIIIKWALTELSTY